MKQLIKKLLVLFFLISLSFLVSEDGEGSAVGEAIKNFSRSIVRNYRQYRSYTELRTIIGSRQHIYPEGENIDDVSLFPYAFKDNVSLPYYYKYALTYQFRPTSKSSFRYYILYVPETKGYEIGKNYSMYNTFATLTTRISSTLQLYLRYSVNHQQKEHYYYTSYARELDDVQYKDDEYKNINIYNYDKNDITIKLSRLKSSKIQPSFLITAGNTIVSYPQRDDIRPDLSEWNTSTKLNPSYFYNYNWVKFSGRLDARISPKFRAVTDLSYTPNTSSTGSSWYHSYRLRLDMNYYLTKRTELGFGFSFSDKRYLPASPYKTAKWTVENELDSGYDQVLLDQKSTKNYIDKEIYFKVVIK